MSFLPFLRESPPPDFDLDLFLLYAGVYFSRRLRAGKIRTRRRFLDLGSFRLCRRRFFLWITFNKKPYHLYKKSTRGDLVMLGGDTVIYFLNYYPAPTLAPSARFKAELTCRPFAACLTVKTIRH